MLNVKLKVVGGDAKTTQVNLKLPTIIGRSKQATLTLPHPLVSRNHCELFEREEKLWVKDLASLNGTFIDNVRLDGEQILEPKQLLTIGNVTFRAIYGTTDVLDEDRDDASFAKPGDSSKSLSSSSSQNLTDHELEVEFNELEEKRSDSFHNKKTESGNRHAAVTPIEETVYITANQKNATANADQNSAANASIVAALADIVDDVSGKSFSQSALGELSIEDTRQADLASSISSVDIHDGGQAENPQVGQSFLDVIDDQEEDSPNLSSYDSSLDSFIRKLPK